MNKSCFFFLLFFFCLRLNSQVCLIDNPEINLLGSNRDMHMVDIDGDGKKDILVSGSVGIQVCKGNNTLTFNSPDTLLSEADTYSFGTGDLDLDGDVDIVLGTQDSIITYLQGPVNTFSRLNAFPVTVGEFSSCIVLSDISGNGLPDLMWSSQFGADFHVRMNTGGGTWGSISTYTGLGTQLEQFVVTDLDNDSHPDIAATSQGIAVFRNLGNGTFSPAVSVWNAGGYASSIVADDLNNDGFVDLIAGSFFGSNFSINSIYVYKNNGAMQFQHMGDYKAGGCINAMTITDLNGDGLKDIATADNWSGSVSGLIAASSFVFNKLIQYDVSNNLDIESGDYDQDGDYDIIAMNSGKISILENDSNKRIMAETRFPAYHEFNFEPSFRQIEVKDVDGDSIPEIITAGNLILLMKDTGYKNFAPWTWYFPNETVETMKAEDMDGDGDFDLIYSSYVEDSVFLMLNNGNGFFASPVSFFVGAQVGFFCIDDMDHDGDKDIILPRHSLNKISIMYNDGTGHFPTIQDIPFSNNPNCLATGDLNGDLLPDIVVGRNSTANVVLLTNLGSGNFSSQTFVVPVSARIVHIADSDNDGDNDFAVYGVGANLQLFENNAGTFTPLSINFALGVTNEFQFGNLTDDSLPELVSMSDFGVLQVNINNGNNSFSYDRRTGPGNYAFDFAIADYDSDSDNDLLTPTEEFGCIDVSENCDTTLYHSTPSPLGITNYNSITGQIAIEPNPFSAHAIAAVTNFNRLSSVRVFDISGKDVTSLFGINRNQSNDNSFRISLEADTADPGIYFLQLVDVAGFSSVKKFILVR